MNGTRAVWQTGGLLFSEWNTCCLVHVLSGKLGGCCLVNGTRAVWQTGGLLFSEWNTCCLANWGVAV